MTKATALCRQLPRVHRLRAGTSRRGRHNADVGIIVEVALAALLLLLVLVLVLVLHAAMASTEAAVMTAASVLLMCALSRGIFLLSLSDRPLLLPQTA